MNGQLKYTNVQYQWYNNGTWVNSGEEMSPVLAPFSDTAGAAYEQYKQYTQSNVFQVGTWANTGVGNTPVATLNSNWDTVCSAFGINPKALYVLLTATYNYAPSVSRQASFADNVGFYSKGVYNRMPFPGNYSTSHHLKYNNSYYGIYAMPYGSVSNFRNEVHYPIYDTVEERWYQFGWEFRTDSVNGNKVWLVTAKPQVTDFFPTSGIPIWHPSDPYPNIEPSTTGGGDGSGTDSSDSNPVPSLPSISAVGTGLCRLYNPTVSQLRDLGAWMWGSGLDLNALKKIFADPVDAILGCSIFPVAMPRSENPETIIFGNIDSGISAYVVSEQYTTRDLGTIEIDEMYNSYLDYAPYTKVQIFLPYIGMKTLNTDEVMGKTLGVVYSIDLLSGGCVAHVYIESQLMYEFGGTCNTQIPLTARDYTATVQGLLGILGGSVAAGVAAFALPEAIPAVAGAAGLVGGLAMNAAKQTVASKPTVEHASGIGGSTGIMSSQKAYVLIERPRLCHPENQEHFTGYPGFLYRTVNELEGFTKFVNFEFVRIHATEPELDELREWFMEKGVRI